MKREHLLWLLTTNAGAAPLLQWGQGSNFHFAGLRFGMDGNFKISVFEDLHFGEPADVGGPIADLRTIGVMNTILDVEPPNLVVLNGDLITCENVATANVSDYIDQIVEPLKSRNIPWASTYGNHDMSKTCSTRVMAEREQAVGGKLAWTKMMVDGEYNEVGTSNYYVPIYASSGGGNPRLAMLLWFFDSKGGRAYQQTDPDGEDVPVADYVDQKVVDWFNLEKRAIAQQHPNQPIPSLAFVHIPIHATWTFQHGPNMNSATEPGINEDNIGHQGISCDALGKNCYWNKKDTPFMKSLAATEDLMAVFSGHDHGDDWCMKWASISGNEPPNGNSIHLCFGRHTGYGGYSDWTRGARQIVVHEDSLRGGEREVETWIRLEDGKISGHVVLNETYGMDRYPPVEKTTSAPISGEGKGQAV
ncbi:Metallo-dependent phosphatase [Melanomma pulvis-pyrius CBS 109.77]|uniref:Metallo-dependent phosphatase n=1 Tax=Melanomma pulvis-pyrius CBS 109.77 TaxID=1314802 RepID=A0A6A6XLS9_9PLEO|nr:Metallo-dependent phosphatase [Melanomma pulvis-pyrius CBS 109.77]